MAKVPLRVYNREIETMMDRGQLDEAIAHCHHIFKTFPKHLETYRLLGKAYLENKRYREAVDVFSRVLVSEPNDFVANVGMSIIRDEENKLDDAIWHMERAFEVQPSNAAIQGELQRLYGRRDGVQPPRIRMTRGALAHMYVQGELYPQAISEIKSVLKEDPGRSDMETLLARACYRSGLKNEAADAASKVLRRYPYCLDANRVLMEIFSVDHPENAQVYRQRVLELDPYAAHVTGTVFQSNEVLDAAVTVERLDWNGQPVGPGAQAEWSTNQAIGLESGLGRDEQPDWLRNAYADTTPPTSPSPTRPIDQTPAGAVPAFDTSAKLADGDEIPDFLRAAGWGQPTGAFDESKPIFGEEQPATTQQPIEQGEIPDWVKAMAPAEAIQPPPAEEEELPDWINRIGSSSLPVPSASDSEQADWMSQLGQASETVSSEPEASPDLDWISQLGQPAQSAPAEKSSDDDLDWIKQLDQAASPVPATPSDDLSDWMSQPSQPEQVAQAEPISDDQPDWVKQLDQPEITMPASTSADLPDWLTQADQPAQSTPVEQPSEDQSDWMKPFDQPVVSSDQPDWMRPLDLTAPMEPALDEQPDWLKQTDQPAATSATSEFDFLDEPIEAVQAEPSATTVPAMPDVNDLGVSEQERDDSFAWLESLAAKQGATEGLLTKPEERHEEEPEWVRQAKALQGLNADRVSSEESATIPEPEATLSSDQMEAEAQWLTESTPVASELPAMEDVAPVEPAVPQPSSSLDELGKSEQERDDSFAWLESLAAKQGASEGLLTKPEERREQEPAWVRQAKELGTASPLEQQPAKEETPPVEEVPSPIETTAMPEPAVNLEDLGKSDQERDDSFAWLESLAAKQGASEGLLTRPEDRLEEEPEWVKQAKDLSETMPSIQTPAVEEESFQEAVPSMDDTAAWPRGLDEEEVKSPSRAGDETGMWLRSLEEESTTESKPSRASDETGMWLKSIEAGEPSPEPTRASDETGIWLKGLAEGEERLTPASAAPSDETGMWLRSLSDEQSKQVSSEPSDDETAMWLKSLDEAERAAAQPEPEITEQPDLPAWMQNIDEESAATNQTEAAGTSWAEEPAPPSFVSSWDAPKPETGSLPSWLRGLEKTESQGSVASPQDELPAWLRDETGEFVAEPTRIEPTRASDWQPAEPVETEPSMPEPVAEWQQPEEIRTEEPAVESVAPEPEPVEVHEEIPAPMEQAMTTPEPESIPAPPPQPYKDTRKGTGMLAMPGDSILGSARAELSRSNIPGALETYSRLIKKGRFLDEIIHDLRDALYRYPVEVSIWQSLGDAYMRANRLQDALDAYTKAEELLR